MNLYQSPNILELAMLLTQQATSEQGYALTVDDTGEVLVEHGLPTSGNALTRFKFYIHDFKVKFDFGNIITFNLTFLSELYKNIIFCWENNIEGIIDYDKIDDGHLTYFWNKMFRNHKLVPGALVFTSPN
jgi:hypothetical protein